MASALLALVLTNPIPAAADTVTFDSGNRVLHGLIYKPVGPGPFPVILYNHGSAPGLVSNQAFEAIAPAFVAHGWVFFAPYRRGQGLSSDAGPYIRSEIQTAEARDGREAGEQTMIRLLSTEQLEDQMAALAWLRQQAFAQAGRVATMGNSFGGIETVLGAEQADYCAAVDAAGGAESWDRAPRLKGLMLDAVHHARAPILFMQASNDFTTEPSQVLYNAMKADGKIAEIKIYRAYGHSPEEGHSFVYRQPRVWEKDVFRFLQAHCSP